MPYQLTGPQKTADSLIRGQEVRPIRSQAFLLGVLQCFGIGAVELGGTGACNGVGKARLNMMSVTVLGIPEWPKSVPRP